MTRKDFFAWMAVLFVILIFVGVLNGFGLGMKALFAPASVAIDNKVFHESQQYNDSMAHDLDDLRLSYLSATPEGKAVIRATILHRFGGFDASHLAPDQQLFLTQIRGF